MPNKLFYPAFILSLIFLSIISATSGILSKKQPITGAPPYGESLEDVPEIDENYSWLYNWIRPEGPAKVGLQVGHWKNDELPEELNKLKGSTGASVGSFKEWELNHKIAVETAEILEEKGIDVDIIPATVPEKYWADVFVAIHADGNESSYISGYKVAGPWRSHFNSSDRLVELIDESYGIETKMIKDDNISRNMRGYYAFSWWKYDHAIHPMTSAVIIETGFITNYNDRKLLNEQTDKPANGIANGIVEFLIEQDLLNE
jgi:N-acetylmuramoyl-L-alanine amidase